MTLPKPVPGLVIRYSYLWFREPREGRDEGRKDRPCALVAALRSDEHGNTRALVLPITHTLPVPPEVAVEMPAEVKRRLGLDKGRSWIILSEWNDFVWPGHDLRRVSQAKDASVAYGMRPPALFATIRDRFLAIVDAGKARQVKRT